MRNVLVALAGICFVSFPRPIHTPRSLWKLQPAVSAHITMSSISTASSSPPELIKLGIQRWGENSCKHSRGGSGIEIGGVPGQHSWGCLGSFPLGGIRRPNVHTVRLRTCSKSRLLVPTAPDPSALSGTHSQGAGGTKNECAESKRLRASYPPQPSTTPLTPGPKEQLDSYPDTACLIRTGELQFGIFHSGLNFF